MSIMLRCAVYFRANHAHANELYLWELWRQLVGLPCAQVFQVAVWLQVQQHCGVADPEQRPKHTRTLMRSLADWAEAHRALNEVVQLPLSTEEEEASLMVPMSAFFFAFLQTETAAWQVHSECRIGCLKACLWILLHHFDGRSVLSVLHADAGGVAAGAHAGRQAR